MGKSDPVTRSDSGLKAIGEDCRLSVYVWEGGTWVLVFVVLWWEWGGGFAG